MTENTLYGLAVDVANHLSQLDASTWTAVQNPHSDTDTAYLVHQRSGMRLYMHRVWNEKGKLNISLSVHDYRDFARYDDPKFANDGINVTAARGALAIAKDIDRRLLTDAREYFLSLVERKSSKERYDNHRHSLAAKMARAAGLDASAVVENDRNGHVGFDMRIPNAHSFWYPPRVDVGVSLSIDSQQREHELVNIKFENLTPEEAERVLALAKQIMKGAV